MGVSGYGPAAHIRFRESVQGTNPNDARSELPLVNAEDPRPFDVDDFRRWWGRRLPQEAAQDRSRRRKLKRVPIALVAIALVSSALALNGGAPTLLKGPPVALLANDTVRAQKLNGETAGTSGDISTPPPAGLSGATPVAPKVDLQVVEELASNVSAQATGPEPARSVSVPSEGMLIASQASSAAERGSTADTVKASAKPASERMNGAVGTTQRSFDLPAKRPGKLAARVVVGKNEAAIPSAAVDTPSPPLPIGAPANPEGEAGKAEALQPMSESVASPATPAEAAKQSHNPLLRALGDLFGARAVPAQQPIDFAAVESTGWAVQLRASSSEAEAERDLKRINTKYRSALRGSTVSLHKVLVNGATVYRPHIVGLSRDKAAGLCARVKSDGGSCSIVR